MHKEQQPGLENELRSTPALKAELDINDSVANWEKNQELVHAIEVLEMTGAQRVYLEPYLQSQSETDEIDTSGFRYSELPGASYLELIMDRNNQVVGVRRKGAKMVS